MGIEIYVQREQVSQQSNPIKIKKTYQEKYVIDKEGVVDIVSVDCYDSKQNFFDPNKGSPPTNWTIRLLGRIEKYN